MTRALITDEVRTGHSMGPVQLGYVFSGYLQFASAVSVTNNQEKKLRLITKSIGQKITSLTKFRTKKKKNDFWFYQNF